MSTHEGLDLELVRKDAWGYWYLVLHQVHRAPSRFMEWCEGQGRDPGITAVPASFMGIADQGALAAGQGR